MAQSSILSLIFSSDTPCKKRNVTFAKANNVNFLPPNHLEMSNEDLGQLITEATVFLECWMTIAKIKQIIAQEENRKAFYSEFK